MMNNEFENSWQDIGKLRIKSSAFGSLQRRSRNRFKVDRLQMIVVAKNLSVLQLFISRMPKMCAILQLVSAPLM